MTQTLTLPQVVGLVTLYCAIFFALCKLTDYFDDQYKRAFLKQEQVSKILSSLIDIFDAKLRAKLQRGSEIKLIRFEDRVPELRDVEYSFLPETEYRLVIAELFPHFIYCVKASKLARWLPKGFLWLWRLSVVEILGMFVLAGAAIYEVIKKSNCLFVFKYCFIIQASIIVFGFILYILLKIQEQYLYAIEKTQEAESQRA
jgi:hypothetical protein